MNRLEESQNLEKGLSFFPLEDSVLRLEGKDLLTFLQGILSNDTRLLKPEQGLAAFFLNAKGKWIAELKLLLSNATLFAKTSPEESKALQAAIQPLILFSESQLSDVSSDYQWILALGPQVESFFQNLGLKLSDNTYAHASFEWEGNKLEALRIPDYRLPAILLLSERSKVSQLLQSLMQVKVDFPLQVLSSTAWESLRIESKIPLFGKDVDEKTIPLEAGFADHFSYTKGCYVGQETISRIKHYGRVNKKLFCVKMPLGKTIPENAELFLDGKAISKITSFCESHFYEAGIGLAILPHDLSPGSKLQIPSQDCEAEVLA